MRGKSPLPGRELASTGHRSTPNHDGLPNERCLLGSFTLPDARNHHYVSQFYLKGFARLRSKNETLTVFDLPGRRQFATKPRNIGAARDFNRMNVPGRDPNYVETELGKFEDAADAAFGRIIKSRSIGNFEDFATALQVLAFFLTRHPSFRDNRAALLKQIYARSLELMVDTRRFRDELEKELKDIDPSDDPVSFDFIHQAIRDGKIEMVPTREYLIQQEFELIPTVLPLLDKRRWTLFRSNPQTGSFATSDRPASLLWNDDTFSPSPYAPGLGMKGTSILFPISKHLMLQGTFDEGANVVDCDKRLVGTLNFMTFATANKQIYSDADFHITDKAMNVALFSKSIFWRAVVERPE